jgi:hypothetical protein
MPPLGMILSQSQTHKISHSKIYVFDGRPRTFTITNIKVLSSSKSCAIFTYRVGPILLYIPTTSFLLLFSYIHLGLLSGSFPRDVGKGPSLFVCMWARPNRINVKLVLERRQTDRETDQAVFKGLHSATCTDACESAPLMKYPPPCYRQLYFHLFRSLTVF